MDNIKIYKSKTIPKGQLLLSPGEICSFGYLVVSGCLKSYVIDNTGKEHILQFAPEDWFISDIDSVTNGTPAIIFIDAIEESTISLVSKSDYDDLYSLEKEILISMNIKYRNNIIAANKRVIGLLSNTAEQRYLEFTQTYPTLVQRLPLKLIASYIGITPEYLSDIRRKIAKKHPSSLIS
ncbi:MAG: Crp/Fnr family transcriptional regulator [Rhodothermales bacterium]